MWISALDLADDFDVGGEHRTGEHEHVVSRFGASLIAATAGAPQPGAADHGSGVGRVVGEGAGKALGRISGVESSAGVQVPAFGSVTRRRPTSRNRATRRSPSRTAGPAARRATSAAGAIPRTWRSSQRSDSVICAAKPFGETWVQGPITNRGWLPAAVSVA